MQHDMVATLDGENPDQPICDLASACRLLFNQILRVRQAEAAVVQQRLSILFRSRPLKGQRLSLSDIVDEYEQFSVWSKNLGVFASDNSSLDFRLREASEARDGVVSLLRGLREDLSECTIT